MPPRVTDADVQAIVATTLNTTPFIAAAHAYVDARLLSAGLSEATLTSIELFVAASYVARADPRVTMEAMDDQRTQYETGTVWEQLWQIAVDLAPPGVLVVGGLRPATFDVF